MKHSMRFFRSLLCLFGLAACAGEPGPSLDSESHFLTACVDNGDCGTELSCICNVCTSPCDDDDSCAGTSPESTCLTLSLDPLGGACTTTESAPEAPRVCLEECSPSAACGDNRVCVEGACLPPVGEFPTPEPGPDAGAEDAGVADALADLGDGADLDIADADIDGRADLIDGAPPETIESEACTVVVDEVVFPDSASCGIAPGIALDSAERPHLSWLRFDPIAGQYSHREASGDWSSPDTIGDNQTRTLDVAVAPDGTPVVLLEQHGGDVSVWTGSPWSSVQEVAGVNVLAGHRSVGFDPDGTLHAAMQRTEMDGGNTTWSIVHYSGTTDALVPTALANSTSSRVNDLNISPDGRASVLYWIAGEHFHQFSGETAQAVEGIRLGDIYAADVAVDAFGGAYVLGELEADAPNTGETLITTDAAGGWQPVHLAHSNRSPRNDCPAEPSVGDRCDIDAVTHTPRDGGIVHLDGSEMFVALVEERTHGQLQWECGLEGDLECNWTGDLAVDGRLLAGSLSVGARRLDAVPGVVLGDRAQLRMVVGASGRIHLAMTEVDDSEFPGSCSVRYLQLTCL